MSSEMPALDGQVTANPPPAAAAPPVNESEARAAEAVAARVLGPAAVEATAPPPATPAPADAPAIATPEIQEECVRMVQELKHEAGFVICTRAALTIDAEIEQALAVGSLAKMAIKANAAWLYPKLKAFVGEGQARLFLMLGLDAYLSWGKLNAIAERRGVQLRGGRRAPQQPRDPQLRVLPARQAAPAPAAQPEGERMTIRKKSDVPEAPEIR